MTMSILRQLRVDTKNVQHDMFLLYLLPIPIILAMVFPLVFELLQQFLGLTIAIESYYEFATVYIFLVLSPLLWGTVFGFLIINEKDLRTLQAIQVTPSGLRRLIHYRIFSGCIISMISQIVSFLLLGTTIGPKLIGLMTIASFFAPLSMFGMSIIAKNKVQAFALMKVMSSIFVVPFFYILVPTIEFVFFIIPPYWVVKVLVNDYNGVNTPVVVYLLGTLVNAMWLVLLRRQFLRGLRRS